MKALCLEKMSKKQIQLEFWVQQFGWKKIVKVFTCFFSGEHFNSCKKIHARLKACEIFASGKFIYTLKIDYLEEFQILL